MKLHVIFLAMHPGVVDFGMSPSKRLATIELTSEQVKALYPRFIGSSGGRTIWESIDQAFLEGNEIKNPADSERGVMSDPSAGVTGSKGDTR